MGHIVSVQYQDPWLMTPVIQTWSQQGTACASYLSRTRAILLHQYAEKLLNEDLLAAGIGTPDIPYTLVPGDVASSVIVASMAATAAGQGSQDSPNITQACTSCSNPLTLRQLTDSICQYFR